MADYFTKPLQGALFIKMRDSIKNVNPQCLLGYASEDCRSVLDVTDTETHGANGGWIMVESKKEKQTAERAVSRVSADKNGSMSCVTGQQKSNV